MKKITRQDAEKKLRAGDFVYDEYGMNIFGGWGVLLKDFTRVYLDHVGKQAEKQSISSLTKMVIFLEDLSDKNAYAVSDILNNRKYEHLEDIAYELVDVIEVEEDTVALKEMIEDIVDARIKKLLRL